MESALSRERLATYRRAARGDDERALALYLWNLQLGAAFYPLLSVVEVTLRNTCCRRIEGKFGPCWWEDARFHALLGGAGKGIVLRARDDRLGAKGWVTSGCMTAALTFGFWSKMFLPKHERTLWTPLSECFPAAPVTAGFLDVATRVARARDLRNRVFHHEPIFNRDVTKDYSELLVLLRWANPEAEAWLRPTLRVMSVMRQRP